MKALFIALALIISLTFSQPATALSGNELMKLFTECESYDKGDETFDNYWSCGSAAHYILGVIGGYRLSRHWDELPKDFCVPDGVKIGQIHGIVKKDIEANPEKWHFRAETQVINAIIRAFPCD